MTFPRAMLVRVAAVLLLFPCAAPAATIAANHHTTHSSKSKSPKISESASAKTKMAKSRHTSKTAASRNRSTHTVTTATSTSTSKSKRHKYYERFSGNSFALDQTEGDITAGEDPVVRAAAIDALGNMNGTIVAIDPDSGRILAMVNQKLALSAGAQPCSTIKVAVALAALSENVITKDTLVPLGKYWQSRPDHRAGALQQRLLRGGGPQAGIREGQLLRAPVRAGRAGGLNIPGEHLGRFPSDELDAKLGGVGKMCSFGESISLTPLQLAALMASIANGGTLYYLQHPDHAGRSRELHAQGKTPAGHRAADS